MNYSGFCGPSNPSQAVIANCERTVNWYLEQIQSPAAPTDYALLPTPGFQPFVTLDEADCRGGIVVDGRAFAVNGIRLYEIFSNGTKTVRGVLAADANPATLSYNGVTGDELGITSGGNFYLYDLTANTLTQIATLNGEATMAGAINNRFVVFDADTGKIRVSDLNDGATYGAALFFYRQNMDPAKAMVTSRTEIWIVGESSWEAWFDSGAFPQPFAPYPGASGSIGTAAPWSLKVAGEYITWIAAGTGGAGRIVAARGFSLQPISTAAVDTALGRFEREAGLSDAETLVYEDQGHLFAAFAFPSSDATWVYDFTTGAWHERGTWQTATGQFTIWHPRVHLYAFGKHFTGERTSGVISQMDVTFGGDTLGRPIRRLRIPPPIWAKSRERLVVSEFELMLDAGLGTTVGPGSDPQVMLRGSKDAKTWGVERMASAGKMGEYSRRCIWRRVASSEKLFVPMVTVTDAVPWRIAGARLEGSGIEQTRGGKAA